MGRLSRDETVLQAINIAVLCLLSAVAFIPLLSVLSLSLSSRIPVEMDLVTLWPIKPTLESWGFMLAKADLWRSFAVTLVATVVGTVLALLLNAITAYPMAKKEFRPASILMIAVVVTMMFKAPLIPYFLTVKAIGLYNNPLVLVVPHVLSAFNLIIMVSFFRQFPPELEEAGYVEGCGYFRRLFQIVLPLSKAAIATVGLFYTVSLWNQFQHPLMFIQNPNLFPLQIKVRQLVSSEDQFPLQNLDQLNYNASTLQAVTIIFAIIPILMVYPYLQKHFTKGALIGSVKG